MNLVKKILTCQSAIGGLCQPPTEEQRDFKRNLRGQDLESIDYCVKEVLDAKSDIVVNGVHDGLSAPLSSCRTVCGLPSPIREEEPHVSEERKPV